MNKGRHRIVHKQARLRNESLPFTLRWNVVLLGEEAVPFGSGHQFREIIDHERVTFILDWLRSIENVSQVLLLNASIVMD